jgi:prophage regulatory protein
MANPVKLYRLPAVIGLVGLSRSTLEKMVKLGQFPAPTKLGARAKAWHSEDIDAWIKSKKSKAGEL